MLTGDVNEKCKTKKEKVRGGGGGFMREKNLCTCSTFFCAFLCHCFARLQRTWNFLVARYMEEKSYIFLVRSSFFCSLPLILTLLAASICHFLIAALNFSCFFFRNELRLLSFLFFFFCCCCCCFLFCFVFRSSSFSVIGVSVVVAGGICRTHGHVITKFSRIYRLPFFFCTRQSFANTHSLLQKVVSYW